GGADGFREDEHAGGVAVEAVDETRLFGGVGNQGAGERIDVARRTRAALHGKAGGLVEGDDALVLVDDEVAHHVGVGGFYPHAGLFVVLVRLAAFRRRHRRDAHALAGVHPGRGFGAGAVDADLARAAGLLDLALGKPVELALEPAVEARVVLVGIDVERDHLTDVPAHPSTRLASAKPRAPPTATAARPAMTVPMA